MRRLASLLVACLAAVGCWRRSRFARARAPAASACAAAGSHHAALVVEHGDGSVVTRCVAFTAPTISGEELLNRSGVAWSGQTFGGFGDAVCALDGEPARYIDCPGKDRYWAVFVARGRGQWQLANVGISSLTVHDGDAEGFRFDARIRDSGRAGLRRGSVRGARTPAPRRSVARWRRRPAPPGAPAAGGDVPRHRPRPAPSADHGHGRSPGRTPRRPRPSQARRRLTPPQAPAPAPSGGVDTGLLLAAVGSAAGWPGWRMLRLIAGRRPAVTATVRSAFAPLAGAAPSRPIGARRPGPASLARLVARRGDRRARHRQPGLSRAGGAGGAGRPADVAAAGPPASAAGAGGGPSAASRPRSINLLASHTGADVIVRLPDWLPLFGGPLTRRIAGVRRHDRARSGRRAARGRAAVAGPGAARRRGRHARIAGADRDRGGHLAQPRLGLRADLHRGPRRAADARLAAARAAVLERGPGADAADRDRGFGPSGRGDGGARVRRRAAHELCRDRASDARDRSSWPRRLARRGAVRRPAGRRRADGLVPVPDSGVAADPPARGRRLPRAGAAGVPEAEADAR